MFPQPVGVSNRRHKTGCIGIGSDQAAIVLPDNRVHCADLVANAARITDQIHDIDLVRQGDIATPPGRVGAP